MSLAKISAFRSKDPATRVGACIVNREKRVIGLGYNGMPRGNDKDFVWTKSDVPAFTKKNFVVHAEVNAILNTTAPIKHAVLYTTLFPCSDCAKFIAQSGVEKVIFQNYNDSQYEDTQVTTHIFTSVGIKFEKAPQESLVDYLDLFDRL